MKKVKHLTKNRRKEAYEWAREFYLNQSHKKIIQKEKLLFSNPEFNNDIKKLRTKLKPLMIKTEKLEAEHRKIMEKCFFYSKSGKPELPPKYPKLLDKHIKEYSEKDKTLWMDEDLNVAVYELMNKYKLYPKSYWWAGLTDFILRDFFLPPSQFFDETKKYFIGKSKSLNLDDKNFGLMVENEENEIALYLRILPDTSLQDVKNGWAEIEKARNFLFGKKRFYPLKNLELAKQILNIDKKYGIRKGVSDYNKQDMIFGEKETFKEEDVGIRKIKQNRHRYKKRFGLKS